MASEIVTTTTTIAGLMERVQADAVAGFEVGSRLFDACQVKVADNASAVQFWQSAVPSGIVVSAQTEANALTATAITKSAVACTLVTYPFETILSKLALEGGQWTSQELANDVVTYVGAGIDRAICAELDDFTPEVTASGVGMKLATFQSALNTLNNQGFMGQPVCIMGYGHWATLAEDLGGKYNPQINNEIRSRGYVGTVDGVEIFTVPDVYLPDGDCDAAGSSYAAMFYRHLGIGLGYHEPLIRVEFTPYDTANVRFGAYAHAGVTQINVYGGVKIDATLEVNTSS